MLKCANLSKIVILLCIMLCLFVFIIVGIRLTYMFYYYVHFMSIWGPCIYITIFSLLWYMCTHQNTNLFTNLCKFLHSNNFCVTFKSYIISTSKSRLLGLYSILIIYLYFIHIISLLNVNYVLFALLTVPNVLVSLLFVIIYCRSTLRKKVLTSAPNYRKTQLAMVKP